ncbi:hypothetical protein TELCIR_02683 [Teladorsagia circumcincta]|uniref:Prolyl 4-hydroxylase alpha subunit domain-containing protein n=1 Tax=Teladorsagia circumcincta TaxID=45464 RepID=A0A2G9UYH2_TELCI|nr:hypothetical protein TELCIR_02683 [Teladorsagia circumcincta]
MQLLLHLLLQFRESCSQIEKIDNSRKEEIRVELECHVFVRNYQFINVEVLSEDPILFIYRGFAPAGYVEDFLEDVHVRRLTEQVVVNDGEENVTELSEVRRANGTWIPHTASYGAARMYERAVALLPFINFESSEPWQVLSYLPGGHYAPHNDYIEFASPAHYDRWTKRYGNRMATLFLLCKESNSLHGGCPVYEGEKIAAVLWIRMKGQNMFRSASNQLSLRELMEL